MPAKEFFAANGSSYDPLAFLQGEPPLPVGVEDDRWPWQAPVDALVFFDEQGQVQSLNEAGERLFGYSGAELDALTVGQLIPEFKAMDGACLSGCEPRRSCNGLQRDGSLFPLAVQMSRVAMGGQSLFVATCHDGREHRAMLDQVSYLSRHDSLTGCLNRQHFYPLLQQRLDVASLLDEQLMVLMIDLDGFGAINDRYGHRAADGLLAALAERLRQPLREGDMLGRIGGDEFALVIGRSNLDNLAERFAQRLAREVAKPLEIDGARLQVGVSIGVAVYPQAGMAADELLGNAALAMQQRKLAGGRGVALFETGLRHRHSSDVRLLERLCNALANDRLTLHYQLQCRLDDRCPVGMEALLRWEDEEYGQISPDTFLPLAEKHGLMPALSEWVLRRACRDNRLLIDQGLLDVPVAVNICASLFHRGDFAQLVARALRESGLPGNRLELEVTESVAMSDYGCALLNIRRLRGLGVTFAMDDFGVGFSSLARLKSLPFDCLKIDRSFIAGLPDDANDRAIVQAIIRVAALVNMRVVAEGVESREQAELLLGNGCSLIQGYWYARPLPLEQLRQGCTDWVFEGCRQPV